MRLVIGKNGSTLDLREGTSVQLDLISPLYFADNRGGAIPSVKTYSISVPNTTHNRLLLGRPAELDNPEDFLEEDDWYINFDGYRILDGKLEVEDGVYEGDIKFTFIGGLAGNLDVLRTLNLRDVEIDPVYMGADNVQVLSTAADLAMDSNSLYVFPTIRIDADGQRQDTTDDDVNNPQPTTYTFLNYYSDGAYLRQGNDQVFPANDVTSTGGVRPFRATIAPQPLLRPLLDKLLEVVQYQLAGIFDSHELQEELNRLVLFSNYTLDEQIGIPAANQQLTFDQVKLAETYVPARSMPNKTGADLLRAVVGLMCLAPVLDTTGRRLILVACQDLLDLPAIKNWTSKVFPQYQRGRRLEEVPNTFYYNNPDENYSSYARRIRLAEVDGSFETVADAEAAYTIADVNKLVYIAQLNEYFDTRFADFGIGTGLFLFPKGKDLGVIGEGNSEPYIPSATTLHSITFTDVDGRHGGWRITNGLLPTFGDSNGGGVRISTAFYADVQSPLQDGEPLDDFIFLLDRGFLADRDGNQSPYAGSNVYNYRGESIGNMSLLWRGEKGLYNVWWKKWIEALRQMRPVSYPTRLTAADLANLDWREKVIIDRHAYFVKRIKVTFTTNEILNAAVEYMQIN